MSHPIAVPIDMESPICFLERCVFTTTYFIIFKFNIWTSFKLLRINTLLLIISLSLKCKLCLKCAGVMITVVPLLIEWEVFVKIIKNYTTRFMKQHSPKLLFRCQLSSVHTQYKVLRIIYGCCLTNCLFIYLTI